MQCSRLLFAAALSSLVVAVACGGAPPEAASSAIAATASIGASALSSHDGDRRPDPALKARSR